MTAAEVASFLAAAKAEGITQATFSGGDPLSHPEIISILGSARELGFFVKLDTVGTALLRDAELVFYGKGTISRVDPADLAPLVDQIGLPLDGADERTQRRFRREPGRSAPRATDEAELFQTDLPPDKPELRRGGRSSASVVTDTPALAQIFNDLNVSVCINSVLHAGNAAGVRALAGAVELIKPDLWQIFEFQDSGVLAARNARAFALGESDTATVTNIRRPEAQLELTHVTGGFESLIREARNMAPSVTIQAKSSRARSNTYFVVNDAGIAWIPSAGGGLPAKIGHIGRDFDSVIGALRAHLSVEAAE